MLIERDGRWLHDGEEVELRAGRGLLGADVAFPILHGPGGEDGSVQGALEVLDIPYTGSDVPASANCLDKLTFKRLLSEAAIPQVDFVDASGEGWREAAAELGLPLWVKPSRLGSSVGISKVTDVAELDAAVDAARRHDPRVIIEAQADGAEVECSLLGNEDPIASVPGEIVAQADWYDFEAKYGEGGMELVVPAGISKPPRPRPGARRRRVRAHRLQRPRPLRLLRRRLRGARQRAQHAPRLHRDQRLRQAARSFRRRLSRALRPPRKLGVERYKKVKSYEF